MRTLPNLLLGALLAAASPRSVAAQVFPASNGEALAGVTAVDAQVLVLNWLGAAADHEPFRAEAEKQFEAALAPLGITIDEHANFLFCELKVAEAGRGVMVYAWSVGYYEFVVGGAHRLLWTNGGIVRVGAANFTPRAVTEECAAAFRVEWQRRNPRP